MAVSGALPAAEGGMVAFWICVDIASHQGQGGRRAEWNPGVQVGLHAEIGAWPMAQF